MSDLYVMATIYNHVYLPTLKPVFLYVLLTNIEFWEYGNYVGGSNYKITESHNKIN